MSSISATATVVGDDLLVRVTNTASGDEPAKESAESQVSAHVFVLDISASMGERTKTYANAMKTILGKLSMESAFSVITFQSVSNVVFETFGLTEAGVDAARTTFSKHAWQAGGQTNLEAGLKTARDFTTRLAQHTQKGKVLNVCITVVTDGDVTPVQHQSKSYPGYPWETDATKLAAILPDSSLPGMIAKTNVLMFGSDSQIGFTEAVKAQSEANSGHFVKEVTDEGLFAGLGVLGNRGLAPSIRVTVGAPSQQHERMLTPSDVETWTVGDSQPFLLVGAAAGGNNTIGELPFEIQIDGVAVRKGRVGEILTDELNEALVALEVKREKLRLKFADVVLKTQEAARGEDVDEALTQVGDADALADEAWELVAAVENLGVTESMPAYRSLAAQTSELKTYKSQLELLKSGTQPEADTEPAPRRLRLSPPQDVTDPDDATPSYRSLSNNYVSETMPSYRSLSAGAAAPKRHLPPSPLVPKPEVPSWKSLRAASLSLR